MSAAAPTHADRRRSSSLALAGRAASIWRRSPITLLNYIGIYALVALGLVLLTGIGGMVSFGQAAFMGIAAYATAWLTALMGYSPWLGLMLALVGDLRRRGHPRRVTLRLRRPFPVAQHHRLGPRDLLPFGNIAALGAYNGIAGDSADLDRLAAARRQRPDLLSDLGHRCCSRMLLRAQSARLARRPRDARAARRQGAGRSRSASTRSASGWRPSCIAALLGGAVRLALRAYEPLRQPDAVRRHA